MQLSGAAVSLTVALFLVGCGPEEPFVRYSGSTLAAHQPGDVKVYRATPPNRPFKELGTVDVACPTDAQRRPFGQVSTEGGCDYETALHMAIGKAAEAGADAIFSIQTTAGANGNVVSLTAVAVQFTGAPPPAPPSPPAASQAKKPTPEERLKRLKQVADQGLITPDEYAKRKAEILEDL